MKKREICLLILLLLLMAPITKARSIRIDSSVETRASDIRLGDIAHLSGEADFIAQVKDIILGQAPLPGYQNYIYREQIISALEAEEIEVNRIDFDIPYQISISADYTSLDIDNLITKGREYIYQNLDYEESDIEIETLNAPDDILRPYGEVELEIANIRNTNLLGRITIPMEIYIDGNLYRRVHLRYQVGVWKEVLIAKDDLSRGDNLSRSDFEIEQRKITSSNTDYISANDDNLSSYELRTALRAGRALESRMITLPDLVDRWSDVQLIAQVGEVQISTQARARESGQLGDRIIVENKTSGERIEAEVIGQGQVRAVNN